MTFLHAKKQAREEVIPNQESWTFEVVEQNRKHAALFKSARSICNSDAEDEAAPGGMVFGSNSKEE